MKRFFSALKQNPEAGGDGSSDGSCRTSADSSAPGSLESLTAADDDINEDEPPTKLLKTADVATATSRKKQTSQAALIENLAQFLNCVVCLDLPNGTIYQCRNGHIMCEYCYVRLLAETSMRKQQTRCPICRIFIPKKKSVRCLCAERAVVLLPAKCVHCCQSFHRPHLEEHQKMLCPARPSQCKYRRIGCMWSGSYDELPDHEQQCKQPKVPFKSLQLVNENRTPNSPSIEFLLKCLSDCRFYCEDLCSTHYNYNNFTHTIYYSTEKFRAWELNWSLKFKFVHPEYLAEDDGGSGGGGGYVQLMLRSRCERFLNVKFLLLQTAETNVHFPLILHEHEFSAFSLESEFQALSLLDSTDVYRILAKTKIKFRFVMLVGP